MLKFYLIMITIGFKKKTKMMRFIS